MSPLGQPRQRRLTVGDTDCGAIVGGEGKRISSEFPGDGIRHSMVGLSGGRWARLSRVNSTTRRTKHLGRGTPGGFTLVEIMIVVAIVGLLASIAIPNLVRAQRRSKAATCISNLRVIDTAIQELKIERPGMPLTEDNIKVFIGRGNGGIMPVCPSGGTYGDFDTVVTCTSQQAGFEHVLPQ